MKSYYLNLNLSLNSETVSSSFLFPSILSTVLITEIISLHLKPTVPILILPLKSCRFRITELNRQIEWTQVGIKVII